MSRAPLRTAEVSRDTVVIALKLFGTIANAHRQLGLAALVSYPIFYRAMNHGAVKPEEKDLIETAWSHWRQVYLRQEVPVSSDLDLDHTSFDQFPQWHPSLQKPRKVAK